MPMPSEVRWIDTGQVNVYLCRDADGFTLIDAAMPGKSGLIFRQLAEFGGRPSELVRIIITHADLDHAGSAAAVQARSGAVVYASAATAALLVKGRSPRHMPRLAQWLLDRFIRYRRVDPNHLQVIAEGDVLPVLGGLHVLAAPGHTPDQHALYSPSTGVCFAGDALNTRGGRLALSPPGITADQAAAERSAARLLALSPAVIAPGHGAPLIDDATAVTSLMSQLQHKLGVQV